MSVYPSGKATIAVTKKEITLIAGNMRLSKSQLITIIQNILTDTLRATLTDVAAWINKFVPKATGLMRDSLSKVLAKSRIKGTILKIMMGSSLYYIDRLNKMSTSQVRHAGVMGYASVNELWKGGKIMLNDPQAIGQFYTKLLAYIKTRTKANLRSSKLRYLGFKANTSPIYKGMKVETPAVVP